MLLFYNIGWLYTLQLYIAGNFQEMKSHQSGKKIIHIFQGFYRFRLISYRYFFDIFLHKAYAYCTKNVQMQIFFWSIFSCIPTEYEDLLRKSLHSVRIQEKTDQKKLRICTLFTQWLKSEQLTDLLARRHLKTKFLTNFENLNPIWNFCKKHTISQF